MNKTPEPAPRLTPLYGPNISYVWFPLKVCLGSWRLDHMDSFTGGHHSRECCIVCSINDLFQLLLPQYVSDAKTVQSSVHMAILEVSDDGVRDLLQATTKTTTKTTGVDIDGSLPIDRYDRSVINSISRPFESAKEAAKAVNRCVARRNKAADLVFSLFIRFEMCDGFVEHWCKESIFLTGNDFGGLLVQGLNLQDSLYVRQAAPDKSRCLAEQDSGGSEVSFDRKSLTRQYLLEHFHCCPQKPLVFLHMDCDDGEEEVDSLIHAVNICSSGVTGSKTVRLFLTYQ